MALEFAQRPPMLTKYSRVLEPPPVAPPGRRQLGSFTRSPNNMGVAQRRAACAAGREKVG